MKKLVLFLFVFAVSFSLSAQTVIFHFIVNMDSAYLGNNNLQCRRPFDTTTDNIEILGNYLDNWVSSSGANDACTDPITSFPIVDFVHIPNSFLYTKTDTVTDSSQSNFNGIDGGIGFQVKTRINHSWDNAEDGALEFLNRVIPVPAGTSEVTVEWIFGDSAQSSVVLVYKMATAIKSITPLNITNLFPNPADGQTMLTYATTTNSNIQISIINLLGETIRTVLNAHQIAGIHLQPINVVGLANGVYFLNILADGSSIARKFSVVN